ncbi:MurR/RpiR family transcriptional regulator [Enterococcus sp. LJL120]
MSSSYLNSLITSKLEHQSEIEKKISAYFSTVPDTIIVEKTITELSEEIGVSITSIYSYVKKLGFKGFQDFKIKVASSFLTNRKKDKLTILSDIDSQSSPMDITNRIVEYNIDLLQDFNSFVDEETLRDTLDILYPANSFSFFGQAASSALAYDAYIKFLRLEYSCNYYMDYHVQLINASKLKKGDVAFLFSHSGKTKETVEIAKILKENGAKNIVFTGDANSDLGRLGDVTFVLSTEETAFGLEFITSRVVYSTLVDILFLCLLYDDEESNKESIKTIRKVLDISKK